MKQQDINLLNANGWTVECESPFEIRHEDGSFGKYQAAEAVLDFLKEQQEEKETYHLTKTQLLNLLAESALKAFKKVEGKEEYSWTARFDIANEIVKEIDIHI